jgi:hypothetical protein
MNQKRMIIVLMLVILSSLSVLLLWIPYFEVYSGTLVVRSGHADDQGIYLLYPYINYWERLTPKDMVPSYMALSPNGETLAFLYSRPGPKPESGIALLSLRNQQIKKYVITPYQAYFHLLTWTHDGQSIFFHIHSEGHVIDFQKLDIKTGHMSSFEIYEKTRSWESINSFAISAAGNFAIEDNGYIYITSNDMNEINLLTKGRSIFLTPDGDIAFLCQGENENLNLCNYSFENHKLTKIPFRGENNKSVSFTTANWSWDERYLVYNKEHGEGDPDYIMMYDTKNAKTYQIYEESWFSRMFGSRVRIDEIAWFSKR